MATLHAYEDREYPLPGIATLSARRALVQQVQDSIRRVRYLTALRERSVSSARCDPTSPTFDPIRAAVAYSASGQLDEAMWLVFLITHFGWHPRGHWRYLSAVYGGLATGRLWDWPRISSDPRAFRRWLHANKTDIAGAPGSGGFGNHRKYESLDAYSPNGTGAVVDSYVKWTGSNRRHSDLLDACRARGPGIAMDAFDNLYRSMAAIRRFGRTARFDYLTMVGNLGIAKITPQSAYLSGATGPLRGAKLLFGGSRTSALAVPALEQRLLGLESHLNVGFQVLEDALCNWQKSPDGYKAFRG